MFKWFRSRAGKEPETPEAPESLPVVDEDIIKDVKDFLEDESDTETLYEVKSTADDDDELAWMLDTAESKPLERQQTLPPTSEASTSQALVPSPVSVPARAPAPVPPGMCIVCKRRPKYSKGKKSFPTCGLACAATLKSLGMCVVCGTEPRSSKRFMTCSQACTTLLTAYEGERLMCVICKVQPSHRNERREFTTCGTKCAAKLVTNGGPPSMCDYCHRKPKNRNHPQCGMECKKKADLACLLCRSQPKINKFQFCGKFCRDTALRSTPLILEVRQGHATYDMVVAKFTKAWRYAGQTCPTIKSVYKIIESKQFLAPYDTYRRAHGKECFRYHGTRRQCQIGDKGHTTFCHSSGCAACSIIRTSFQVSLANPGGAFGPGIYTSSATNKSVNYSNGVMLLAKVVLGNIYNVNAFAQVRGCPAGYDSVVFDRNNGSLNETIVYRNDAIRPVFLIIF